MVGIGIEIGIEIGIGIGNWNRNLDLREKLLTGLKSWDFHFPLSLFFCLRERWDDKA